MKGTNRENPQCVAFKGEVGSEGSCRIYDNRPSCCRDFKVSYEDGVASASCDKARNAKGLRVLEPGDWLFNTYSRLKT